MTGWSRAVVARTMTTAGEDGILLSDTDADFTTGRSGLGRLSWRRPNLGELTGLYLRKRGRERWVVPGSDKGLARWRRPRRVGERFN